MQWETVIGLEVHVQLKTKSKLFCGSSTQYGAEPNTQVGHVDFALPGTLPVLNKAAVEMALKFGLAIDAEIGLTSIFDRKNYFYPDLPKGYQTSQFGLPIVGKGQLLVNLEDNTQKIIHITRAHLEEDAGKSLHEGLQNMTGIDLNRAGIPLLEVVSEPEMRNAKEAVAYLKALHALVVYLDICDGNMQEGSFRCDANISVRPVGQKELGTRAEIKNVNSFRFVERAINYEVERQIDILESGGAIAQETRLYDADKNETRTMRTKEDAIDYRYFPCPDLLPVVIEQQELDNLRNQLPELPWQKQQRFKEEFKLTDYDANVLVSQRALADYFEVVVKHTQASPKIAANWITGEFLAYLNKSDTHIAEAPISAEQLAELLSRIHDNTISGKIAKTVFEAMWQGEGDVDSIIETKGLKQVTDTGAIETMIDEIIANNPEQLEQYRAGKDKLFGFFVGLAMKASKGKANPAQVNEILKQKLFTK
jgi:aspartyl-tRNA(Asn)/glutamyl-tRNA(Gln) amidotransferase subunit B